jgi:hypothetical protein
MNCLAQGGPEAEVEPEPRLTSEFAWGILRDVERRS